MGSIAEIEEGFARQDAAEQGRKDLTILGHMVD
jgi:hypothetical protein